MTKSIPGTTDVGVLSAQASNLLLLAVLFGGFLVGGLRDPQTAAPFLGAVWLTALLGPRPAWDTLKPWMGFLAWGAFSLLASPQPFTGLPVLSRWATLAIFFSVAVSQWGEAQRRQWFWGLAFCSIVLVIAAVMVFSPGYPYVGILPFYYNYTCFVEAAFLCAAFAALHHKAGLLGPARWAILVLWATALAEICWAHSRGGLVAAATGIGVFVWRHSDRRRLILTAAAMAAGLAAGIAVTTWAKLDVIHSFNRPQIWEAAFECSLDHPVLGSGPGQFANAFLKHNFPAGYGVVNFRARADHAHSEIMEAAAEFGWPGLILLLAALGVCLRPGRPDDSSWTREAGLAAFAGMSVQCLTDNMLHLPALGLLYVSALAVARGPASDPAPVERPVWRALTWAGLLLAIFSWVPGRVLQGWEDAAQRAADPGRRLESLLRAARLAPADPYLWEDITWAWLAHKPPRIDEASAPLAQAERLSPFNAVYPELRAQFLARAGDWPKSLAAAGRAVELEPDYLQARLSRVEALLRLGRRDEARGELAEVYRRMTSLGPLLNRGSGYEGFILNFDRARYSELALRAGSDRGGLVRPGGRRRLGQ